MQLKISRKNYFLIPALLSILEPSFKAGKTIDFLKQSGISPNKIVNKITERQPTDNYQLSHAAITHYRHMEFEVALDDMDACSVGHIGGDEFIVILTTSDWESICQKISDQFASSVINFYSQEYQSAGGIQAFDR